MFAPGDEIILENREGLAVDVNPESDVPIVVDVSQFPDWKKLAFYDGAKKLGEITEGKPTLVVKKLKAGYYVFSVLGTNGQGNLRTSNPAMVVASSARATTR